MDKTKLRIKILDILKREYRDDINYAGRDEKVADKLLELIEGDLEKYEKLKEKIEILLYENVPNENKGMGLIVNSTAYIQLLKDLSKLLKEKE